MTLLVLSVLMQLSSIGLLAMGASNDIQDVPMAASGGSDNNNHQGSQACVSSSYDDNGTCEFNDIKTTADSTIGDNNSTTHTTKIPKATPKPQRHRRQTTATTTSSASPPTATTSLPTTNTFGEDLPRSFPDTCQLYMAQSSIPNAGIGIFTASDLAEGAFVGEPEMLVPLTDIMFQNHWLIDDVQWDTGLDPRLYFESHHANSIYYPGFGAQINCHMGLNNVDHTLPTYNSAGYHRAQDPGAGGFTNWHGMGNKVLRDTKAGEELFTNYGDDWFIERHHIMGDIPLSADFPVADDLVDKLYSIAVGTRSSSLSDKDGHVLQDLLELVRENVPPRTASAIPSRWADIAQAAEHGTARHSLGGPESLKTTEWLEANGSCVDHVYVTKSAISQAGRGAFAKRSLVKGSVVSPAPMLQVLRNHTLVHEPFQDAPSDYDPKAPMGIQLLRNYAWGSPDSSMLFLPYSPNVNFINHGSAASGKANVEVRWSSNPINLKDEWSEDLPSDVVLKGFGLLMEFLALRDIAPHEEILVDYGPEWEAAWNAHVHEWTPLKGSDEYVPVDDLDTTLIKTEQEQMRDPYPRNIDTACYFSHTSETEYDTIVGDDDDPSIHYAVDWTLQNNDCLRYCSILKRHTDATTGKTYYGVKLQPSHTSSMSSDCWISPDETIFVREVPAYAVKLVDKKFSRDQHLPNSFRHEIGLPPGLLPHAWLDRKGQGMEQLDDVARGIAVSDASIDDNKKSPRSQGKQKSTLPPSMRDYPDQCQLYLAPSGIPNAGIGIYTSVDIGEGVLLGDAEIAVPMVNYPGEPWMLPDEVFWNKDAVEELMLFEGIGNTDSFIPGFGAQINCHMGLNNVEHSYASMNRAGLSAKKDAGASARSLWGDVTNSATRPIKAGEELFIDYGEHWFHHRKMDFIPFEPDFVVADAIVANLTKVLREEGNGDAADHDEARKVAQDMLNMMRSRQSKRVAFALPERVEELEGAHQVGTARYGLDGHDSIRSQEWLETNGACIDHMYPSKSTISQAGMGAFAKRALTKGTVVAPAPLLHVPREQLEYNQGRRGWQDQLLLNYCLGHIDSQVLLLPYSPIVNYINHGSSTSTSGKHANVVLRWSKAPANKEEWWGMPGDELLKQGFGLSMEFVALRDIAPHEEILMDYGVEWEQAWSECVDHWSPSEEALDSKSPSDMNRRKSLEIRTKEEEEETPYPYNIGTACFYTPYALTEDDEHDYDEETKAREFYKPWADTQDGCLRPCIIKQLDHDRHGKGHFTVTAEMLNVPNLAEECVIPENHYHTISEMPQYAVQFVDRPFTRDPYIDIDTAFRHSIGLPDGLFPKAWLDGDTLHKEE
jgi:hypothetical protein